jgi:hypothetical protein
VIAQRLSTVIDADLILVIDTDRLEEGAHHQLIAAGGAYTDLVRVQLTTPDTTPACRYRNRQCDLRGRPGSPPCGRWS